MMVDLSALAFAVRQALVAKGIPISLSHVQQLTAAALGYGTLAAYQASTDEAALDGASHVVVDRARLEERADELGHGTEDVPAIVVEVLDAKLAGTVHRDTEAFVDWLRSFVDRSTLNDEEVGSQTAMTNHNGVREVYMPVELPDDLHTGDAELIELNIDGNVTMELDLDRPYSGNEVVVEAELLVGRLGKRLYERPDFEVTKAQLRWYGDEDEPEMESHGPNQ